MKNLKKLFNWIYVIIRESLFLIGDFVKFLQDLWYDFSVAISIILIIAGIVLTWNITAYRDIDVLKKTAPAFVKKSGFTITGYEGHAGCPFMGGFVWYLAKDDNNYLYEFSVGNWRGELQIYNLKCLNAVQNQ